MLKSDGSRTRIKYAVTVAVGLVLVLVTAIWKGLFTVEDNAERMRILADAFTFPGIMLLCIGLLSIINKEGFFDGFAYSFKSMRRVWRKNNLLEGDSIPRTYYDYKQSVKGKRKIAWHLILVGIGFIVIAIVLVLLHSGMSNT